MKSQFEEHFRNLLKENEQPFDTQAWEQMSAKLDVTMPVQGAEGAQNPTGNEGIQGTQITQGVKGLSSLSKLILIGTTTTAVVVGTYFVVEPMFRDNKNKTTKVITPTPGPDNIVTPGPDNIVAPGPNNVVTPGPDTKGPDNIGPDNIGPDNIVNPGPDNIVNPGLDNIVNPGPDTKGPDTKGPDNIGPDNIGPDNNKQKITVNGISDMCIGNKQIINNSNSVELIIQNENNSTWKVAAKNKLNFSPKIAGMHQIGFMNEGRFEEIVEFEVSEVISNAFEYDELEYIKGLPTIRAYANEDVQSPVWKISGFANSQKGKSVEVNIYKKGTYTLNLKGTDLFGCEINETTEIDIPKYNLLAVTAFIPQSSDSRKNTFIPYALTQREVSFRMIILDPKDGGLVYQTTDSSMPWDGIDIRNGQEATGNTDYNWRVEIINPSLGEPKIYQGLITLIKK